MSASKTAPATKRAPVKKTAPPRKVASTPPPPPPEQPTAEVPREVPKEVPRSIMDPKVISRVVLGDSRELRITRIPNGSSDNYIRIGINLLPNGQNMSGAVFPASYLDEVIAALRKAHTR